MRSLFFIISLITLVTEAFSQPTSDNLYGMTTEQNVAWLTKLKNASKEEKLVLIQNRFFRQPTFEKSDSDDIPVLVVNGIPISEQMDLKLKDFLAYELTVDKVDIEVVDIKPDIYYRPWTGLIFINVTDKRTKKRMYKNR